jgi:hypothetical protein
VAPQRTPEDIEEEFWQSVKQRKQAGAEGPELYAGPDVRVHLAE